MSKNRHSIIPQHSSRELSELVSIARAITRERDIGRLLDLILEKCRYITSADAGSIYVLETNESGQKVLRFKHSQNDSCKFESSEFVLPVNSQSIAGAVVLQQRPVNIPDVYALEDTSLSFDRSFDERVGYRTRSVIAVPLSSAKREVLGVVQLINKKSEPGSKLHSLEDVDRVVVSFDQHSEQVLTTLAAQAGIALENALLYAEIQQLFEGFVRASVQAIEQRDPTTSGHSLRVSVLSCELAKSVDRIGEGRFREVKFSADELQELEYASLLHDFGKIGVREEILLKAKKLHNHELSLVRARLNICQQQHRADSAEQKLQLYKQGASEEQLLALDSKHEEHRRKLMEVWELVTQANEPNVISQGVFGAIESLAELEYTDWFGQKQLLFEPALLRALKIPRGSLLEEELEEIRKHVVHTFEFLSRIPWGQAFKKIPEIAAAHHERLNGTGYPNGLHKQGIPLQSRIMTVADIYDALTARDRPYKKALGTDQALSILDAEVKAGHIDSDLVTIFKEARIFRSVEQDLQY